MGNKIMNVPVVSRVIGKPVSVARSIVKADGGTIRITRTDGNEHICTRDYRTDRVNLEIVKGRVVRATIG